MKKILTFISILLLAFACNKSEQSNSQNQNEELADDYFKRAKVYFDQENYEAAVSLLDSALLNQSNHISSIATRASAFYNMEDYDGALEDYNKAIELWPTDEANKEALTSLYLERGRDRAALPPRRDRVPPS